MTPPSREQVRDELAEEYSDGFYETKKWVGDPEGHLRAGFIAGFDAACEIFGPLEKALQEIYETSNSPVTRMQVDEALASLPWRKP